MASYESQECCIKGVKHEGTPKGKIETIADRRTYVVHPEEPNGNAVLIFTDVLGIDFSNTQLVADQFAANGYLTVMPDVFGENVLSLNRPPNFDFEDWKKNKMPRPAFVDPIYEKTIQYLRKEAGVKRIGGVGYCFGGKYVCRWLKTGQLDAGYTAHPSFVDAEEVEGIQGPLSIAAAETDIIFPAEKRHETEAILQKHTVPYQMFLYSDVEHGFAVKGETASAKGKFAKEQAFFQAVQWFDEFVKKGSDWKL